MKGKLKQKYYNTIRERFNATQIKHTDFKRHTDDKLLKMCFKQLNLYKEKRQAIN
jgi:hypothetical protein